MIDQTDRLALSRAQHLQSRDHRTKSISDNEEEIDAISDWSESDRECCPLSDYELTSNFDEINPQIRNTRRNEEIREKLPPSTILLEQVLQFDESTCHNIGDGVAATHLSFASDTEKSRSLTTSISSTRKSSTSTRRLPQPAPLLPARRQPTKSISVSRPLTNAPVLPSTNQSSRSRKLLCGTSPTRFYLSRENTLNNTNLTLQHRKDSSVSINSSCPSNEDVQLRNGSTIVPPPITSPISSQTSANVAFVPRVYEVKKIFVDDSDYGRLIDVSTIKSVPARNRQKWGTIVHPPFPLGYQQVSSEKVTHVVERLTSPIRSRDRRTPVQTPSKRYLSVEQTDALINRLAKAKSTRPPDPYFPVQQTSKSGKTFNSSLKTNQNWKSVGLSV